MELQAQKTAATHDLLLLYSKSDPPSPDSSLLHRRGFRLMTQDLLGPLERGGGSAPAIPPPAAAVVCNDVESAVDHHVLPGGIGTYSITQVPAVLLPSPSSMESGERKPEGYISGGGGRQYAGGTPPPWAAETTGRHPGPATGKGGGRSPSPAAAPPPPAPPLCRPPPRRFYPSPESKKRPRMDSTRSSGRGLTEEDDDDDEISRREGSASRGDFSLKATDGKRGDQKQPTTPRSKHSATEQRRRSKINDRFQILRDLLPHNDQKRDKASFLLEVIEYIKFLQEKMQKHEIYPGWNQESAKLVPWKLPRDSTIDHPGIINNGPSEAGFMFSGKFDDNSISVSPTMLSNAQNPLESELSAGVSYKVAETPGFTTKESAMPVSLPTNLYDSMASQSQWFRSSYLADCTINSATLNEQEELTIDEGTVSVSNTYSQELLRTLSQSLQSSGIDLSQASISVDIHLGKRAIRRPAAPMTMPNVKDHDPSSGARAIGNSSVGSSGEESEQARKRHRADR